LGGEGLQRGDNTPRVLKERGYLTKNHQNKVRTRKIRVLIKKGLTEGGGTAAAVEGTSFPLEREEVVDT
jgi:hypothetical protein